MPNLLQRLLFGCLLACSLAAHGQEQFVDPPSKVLTTIPFIQLTGGIVIISAKLNDFPDTLNFVLDSGSSGISLDSATAAYLNLKPVPSDRTIKGVGGVKKVPFLYNQELHFPGLTVDSLNFHVNDYSVLTSVYGEQIDGIIGYSLFSRYIFRLDYDSQRISICTIGPVRFPKGGFLLHPMISTLASTDVRVTDARRIDGRFLYDIGAGVCMMFNQDFVQDSQLLKKTRRLRAKQGEGVGGKIDMRVTVIKEVKLGPYRFHSVPAFVFDDENNVTSYPDMGGLIGNDILRRFNAIINYRKREFYLVPNSHFNEPFDYSYSGIELYLIDGEIVIGDVAEKSPAERAGLKEGDVVVAINNNFSQSLNQYKIALQVVNSHLRMIVRRNNQLKEIEFKTGSIRQR